MPLREGFSAAAHIYSYSDGTGIGGWYLQVIPTTLVAGTSVVDALEEFTASAAEHSEVIGTDTSPNTPVPWVALRGWEPSTGDRSILMWGGRAQGDIFTAMAGGLAPLGDSVEADLAEFLALVSDNIVQADPVACAAEMTPGTPGAVP